MKLVEMTSPQIDACSRDMPVVLPIAAIEQHGSHLPIWTDSLLLGEIVERIERRLSDQVLIAPLQWLGNSEHHLDFCGTLTASPRVYLDMLSDLMNNMIHHGFKRIVFLNGHGGNDTPGKQATFEVRQQHRHRKDLLLLMSTYWSLNSHASLSEVGLFQTEMGHACEWETSMVLAIRPELVGDYQALDAVEPGNPFRPASRAWITKDRSQPGHIGWPALASIDKGRFLLDRFTNDCVQWLEQVIQWNGHSWSVQ